MTRFALCALLALAACGADTRTPDQVACDRQANNDPVVSEMIRKGVGNPYIQREGYEQLRAARQDATVACLRSRGVMGPGGVERQKP